MDGVFNTDPSYAETYGDDLLTGAAKTEQESRALQPEGRAFLQALDHHLPAETPCERYPLELTTGRTVYQFHTRSKTGRAPELDAAAPDAWVELNPADADELGIGERQAVRLESARGAIEVPARLRPIRRGTVFVPFHYGSWRQHGHVASGGQRADSSPSGTPSRSNRCSSSPPSARGPQGRADMQLAHYLGLLHRARGGAGRGVPRGGGGPRRRGGRPPALRPPGLSSVTPTPSGSSRSPSATARRRKMSRTGFTPSSSGALATAPSRSSATCMTSI